MEISWVSWAIAGTISGLGVIGSIIYYKCVSEKEKKLEEEEKKAREAAKAQQQVEEKEEITQEQVFNLAPLIDYISKSLAAGKSRRDIESILLSHGWKAEYIKQAFDSLGRDNGNTVT